MHLKIENMRLQYAPKIRKYALKTKKYAFKTRKYALKTKKYASKIYENCINSYILISGTSIVGSWSLYPKIFKLLFKVSIFWLLSRKIFSIGTP